MGFVSCSFANVFLSDKIILYAIYSASNILTTLNMIHRYIANHAVR